MKKLFLCLTLIAICSLSFASSWYIGVEGGGSIGFYDQRGGYRETKTFSPGLGYEAAIPVEYRINSWLSVNSGLRYIAKAYESVNIPLSIAESGESNMSYKNIEHFFEFPLTLRLVGQKDRMRAYIGLGAYLGVPDASDKNLNCISSPNWSFKVPSKG